jgi:hypothetical protein
MGFIDILLTSKAKAINLFVLREIIILRVKMIIFLKSKRLTAFAFEVDKALSKLTYHVKGLLRKINFRFFVSFYLSPFLFLFAFSFLSSSLFSLLSFILLYLSPSLPFCLPHPVPFSHLNSIPISVSFSPLSLSLSVFLTSRLHTSKNDSTFVTIVVKSFLLLASLFC